VAVLSFQWEKPGPDTVDSGRDYLGPQRFADMEPAALLEQTGTRIAYGSDWPVDKLNEWFALKVGATRKNAPDIAPQYAGQLGTQPPLSRASVLRAITMNSSWELQQDKQTGSLEPGKLADLIILDRNVMQVPVDEIANTQVLLTMVGGKVVYSTGAFATATDGPATDSPATP
jgi:predicted amidohydrolase YtcJ